MLCSIILYFVDFHPGQVRHKNVPITSLMTSPSYRTNKKFALNHFYVIRLSSIAITPNFCIKNFFSVSSIMNICVIATICIAIKQSVL